MATELHNRQICLAVFFTLNSGGEASCPCTLPSVVPPPPPFCSFVLFALGWLQILDWEPQELPAKTQCGLCKRFVCLGARSVQCPPPVT